MLGSCRYAWSAGGRAYFAYYCGEMADGDSDSTLAVALAEYGALRSEVLNAFDRQQRLYLFQFSFSGVVLSFAIVELDWAPAALILPLVAYLLGSRFLQISLGVVRISDYIQSELSPLVGHHLRWEEWNIEQRRDQLSGGRSVAPINLTSAMFVGPALLGWAVGVWGLVGRVGNAGGVELTGLVVLAAGSAFTVILLLRSWRLQWRIRQSYRGESG